MKIVREQGALNLIQLKDALKNLDFNLTENKALKLAKIILKN